MLNRGRGGEKRREILRGGGAGGPASSRMPDGRRDGGTREGGSACSSRSLVCCLYLQKYLWISFSHPPTFPSGSAHDDTKLGRGRGLRWYACSGPHRGCLDKKNVGYSLPEISGSDERA